MYLSPCLFRLGNKGTVKTKVKQRDGPFASVPLSLSLYAGQGSGTVAKESVRFACLDFRGTALPSPDDAHESMFMDRCSWIDAHGLMLMDRRFIIVIRSSALSAKIHSAQTVQSGIMRK